MGLTDDELRDVLARADEIQRASRKGTEWNAEIAAVVDAAQEVGISKSAVERALAERLNLPAAPPAIGALTWAISADGKFYVAEVLSTSDDGARVRFLRGSEHEVGLDQLRPCAFLPGERVVCNWGWWGPWTSTVLSYDQAKKRVKVSDGWGETKTVPVAEVWQDSPKPTQSGARSRVYGTLIGIGAGIGALIGSAITALILR